MKISVVLNHGQVYGGISLFHSHIFLALKTCQDLDFVDYKFVNLFNSARIFGGQMFRLIASFKVFFSLITSEILYLGHINFLRPVMIAYKLGLARNKKIVVFVYGIDIWTPPKWLTQRCLNELKVILVCGSFYTKQKIEDGWLRGSGIDIRVIQNAVDDSLLALRDEPVDKLEGSRFILTVGRQDLRERYKGTDTLIAAFFELKKRETDLRLVIVGAGSDLERLKGEVAQNESSTDVVFIENCSDNTKKWLMGNAECLCLCGSGEGFGYVLIEALALGTSVIGSNLDGSIEACGFGKWGLTVDPSDVRCLKAALEKIVSDPASQDLRFNFPKKQFSQERFTAELRLLNRELIDACS